MWVLVLFFYAGAFSDSDSVSMTNVPGFSSEKTCLAQGSEAKLQASGTKKVLRFACLKVN